MNELCLWVHGKSIRNEVLDGLFCLSVTGCNVDDKFLCFPGQDIVQCVRNHPMVLADNELSVKPGFEEIPDDYSDEFVQNVPINIDNIIRPYSDKELPHKGTEAKRMMTYSGELPFSDPDEYKAERAIEYVDEPWWLLIKEQIRDELALMILKTTFLEKTETEFKIHITPDNLGMLSDSLKTKIRKDLAEKEPLAEKLVFVEDPDSHAKSPNGLAHRKFMAIKNKMARQLNADKKFTEFIRYFGLNPTLDNLHLIKKADK